MSFDWSFFAHLLFHPPGSFVQGAVRTVYLAVIAQALGVALGLLLALWRRSRRLPLRLLAGGYIWLVRGTPLLVQAVIIYDGSSALGLYSFGPLTLGPVSVPGVVQAGVLTLALNEGAYMAEIMRAAIDSVDKGQGEAAESLGLRRRQAMRHVILPQAMRVIIPPLGNEFNNMLKTTSLLAFIGVRELFQDADIRYSSTFKPVEYFAGVAILYLCLTTIWGFIQARIEHRLGASERDESISLRMRLSGIAGRSR
jgi:polar amino acid transport system permease protein